MVVNGKMKGTRMDESRVLRGPGVKTVDAAAVYVEAIAAIPPKMEEIIELLDEIAGNLFVIAKCYRRQSESQNLLTPEDVKEMDEGVDDGPEAN